MRKLRNMKRPLARLTLAATCALLAAPPALPAAEAVGNRRIERIVQRESWVMGYGGAMVLKYRPVVLFTDRTYTTDPDGAVDGKGAIAGRWRERAGKITLISPDGKESQGRIWAGPRPAGPKQSLSGRYSSFSGVGGGGTGTTSVVAWRGFDFAADGTVRIGGGSGSSTPAGDSNASVVTRSTGKQKVARYALDGYTIRFTFDDGSVRKQLFYFMGSKDDVIVIGPQTLSKR
jgi:hypothetical protein